MFDESNITRRSKLQQNDSLSGWSGYPCQQNPHAFKAFYDLLKNTNPVRIIEIGTALGGFILSLRLMSNALNLSPYILTYDIHDRDYSFLKQNNIDVKIENIFSQDHTDVNREVIEYIQQDGTTLVLCDGGNKIGEFNLLSQHLKRGDIIMAHDYAPNSEYFLNEINLKVWNWLEIQDSDIHKAATDNNLKPFMQDSFTQAAWVCKQKG
jgi:predicted O-methyltransferase YrrM